MEGIGSSTTCCSSCCCLEVEVNGQETFMVDQKVITSFSERLAKLFGMKAMKKVSKLKVVFHGFPGGPEGFELMSIFCYSNGRVCITPHNIVMLHLVAHFMEMDKETSCSMPNLLHQTMNSLGGINYWSWSELLSALKQCQDLSSEADSSTISQKIIESLVERLGLPNIATSCTSSSDCSSYRFSTDTRSTESRRTECPNSRTWWFHDLVFLNIYWIGRIVNSMLSREFDHATIIHFLVHYHRSRLIRTDPVERRQIIESVIDLLSLMNQSSLSWKCLSEVFRMSSGSNIRTSQRVLLESLMGSKLDRATLDHLLLPSPNGRSYAYDVDLIRRLASVFFLKGSSSSSSDQQKKVAHLVDSFLLEAAPDFSLPSPRFQSLITIVPEAARESHDKLYQSIDMYLETHNFLGEEQKLEICRALHYEKLPPDALKHFINNMNFPSNLRAEAMQLLTDTQHCLSTARKEDRAMGTRLQGLPPRVLELEKLYTNMQPQKANLTRPQKKSSPLSNSYFPKLCST